MIVIFANIAVARTPFRFGPLADLALLRRTLAANICVCCASSLYREFPVHEQQQQQQPLRTPPARHEFIIHSAINHIFRVAGTAVLVST